MSPLSFFSPRTRRTLGGLIPGRRNSSSRSSFRRSASRASLRLARFWLSVQVEKCSHPLTQLAQLAPSDSRSLESRPLARFCERPTHVPVLPHRAARSFFDESVKLFVLITRSSDVGRQLGLGAHDVLLLSECLLQARHPEEAFLLFRSTSTFSVKLKIPPVRPSQIAVALSDTPPTLPSRGHRSPP